MATCERTKKTIDVLCDLLIEGGASTTTEQRDGTIAHLKECAICDTAGHLVVERLRTAVNVRKNDEVKGS